MSRTTASATASAVMAVVSAGPTIATGSAEEAADSTSEPVSGAPSPATASAGSGMAGSGTASDLAISSCEWRSRWSGVRVKRTPGGST